MANAVLSPVLGTLTDDLAGLQGTNSGMFGGGWYGYVDKDLRTLLGTAGYAIRSSCATAGTARSPRAEPRCGRRSRQRRTSVAAAQGPDPTKWRADATAERLKFAPGLLPHTMRFTNRSTFQQILRFGVSRSSGARPANARAALLPGRPRS